MSIYSRQGGAQRPPAPEPKQVFFKLSPELGDGNAFEIAEDPEVVVGRVRAWLLEFRHYGGGDSFTIETVALTKTEVDALPEL